MIRLGEYAGIYQHFTFGCHSKGVVAVVVLIAGIGFTLYLVENSGNYGLSGL
jgi:hypothetical protein